MVQPGKPFPREFPRAQPQGTPEGQFFQAARGCSTVSQTLLTRVGSWTFKSLKIKPKVAFRLSLGSSLNIFRVSRRVV